MLINVTDAIKEKNMVLCALSLAIRTLDIKTQDPNRF